MSAIFDARAATYAKSDWHRDVAERLVALCAIAPGARVLDAATGTGFAARAAARAAGPSGRIVGVDLSRGMLAQASAAIAEEPLDTIELVEADATRLDRFADGSFDVVLCAAGLLYMDADAALGEWHRLLAPGGRIGFTSMRAGSPPPAAIFRDCAARYGVRLRDPSAPLGTEEACARALERAGFGAIEVVGETVEFTDRDLSVAWDSNFRSPSHEEIRALDAGALASLRDAYLAALAEAGRRDAGALSQAGLLYALGARPRHV